MAEEEKDQNQSDPEPGDSVAVASRRRLATAIGYVLIALIVLAFVFSLGVYLGEKGYTKTNPKHWRFGPDREGDHEKRKASRKGHGHHHGPHGHHATPAAGPNAAGKTGRLLAQGRVLFVGQNAFLVDDAKGPRWVTVDKRTEIKQPFQLDALDVMLRVRVHGNQRGKRIQGRLITVDRDQKN